MSTAAWWTVAMIALPVIAFPLWIAGHFLKARRAELQSIRDRGLLAEAEIVSVRRSMVKFTFVAQGRQSPVVSSCRVTSHCPLKPGQKVPVRYLPGHPHLAIIVEPLPGR